MAAFADPTERFVDIPGVVEIRWVGRRSTRSASDPNLAKTTVSREEDL